MKYVHLLFTDLLDLFEHCSEDVVPCSGNCRSMNIIYGRHKAHRRSVMNTAVPNNAPKPRLCCIKKWEDFEGYGFKLDGERGILGLFHVHGVKSMSPAGQTGLKNGDRVVEVNGYDIRRNEFKQVVERIRSNATSVTLLVLDATADDYYRQHAIPVRGDMSNVVTITCSDTSDGIASMTEKNPPHGKSTHMYDGSKPPNCAPEGSHDKLRRYNDLN